MPLTALLLVATFALVSSDPLHEIIVFLKLKSGEGVTTLANEDKVVLLRGEYAVEVIHGFINTEEGGQVSTKAIDESKFASTFFFCGKDVVCSEVTFYNASFMKLKNEKPCQPEDDVVIFQRNGVKLCGDIDEILATTPPTLEIFRLKRSTDVIVGRFVGFYLALFIVLGLGVLVYLKLKSRNGRAQIKSRYATVETLLNSENEDGSSTPMANIASSDSEQITPEMPSTCTVTQSGSRADSLLKGGGTCLGFATSVLNVSQGDNQGVRHRGTAANQRNEEDDEEYRRRLVQTY